MSVQALAWVLDHSPTAGTERLVLVSIANHAGQSPTSGAWESWPGIATLQREARLDRERTVIDALTRMVKTGAIERIINGAPDERTRRDRRPNLYRVLLQHGVSCGDTRCRWCALPPADTPPTPQRDDAPRHPDTTPRGVASRRHGVSLHDATGCRFTTPKPLLQPNYRTAVLENDGSDFTSSSSTNTRDDDDSMPSTEEIVDAYGAHFAQALDLVVDHRLAERAKAERAGVAMRPIGVLTRWRDGTRREEFGSVLDAWNHHARLGIPTDPDQLAALAIAWADGNGPARLAP